MEQEPNKLHLLLICAALVVFTIFAFEQVRLNDFVKYDDDEYVTENEYVNTGFSWENIRWAFTAGKVSYWHPLTWFSHMLDCELYGLRPGLHHLTNLIIHIANSLLVFLVFRAMTGAVWRSAFVAAVFALHPVNVDSVAWVAERKNVLSTLFWLLVMWEYTSYVRRGGVWRYLVTLLLFVLGLLAKPMLVTLPFVMLVLDYWPFGRLDFGGEGNKVKAGVRRSQIFRLVWEKVPFFVLSGVSVYLSSLSVRRLGITTSTELVPMKLRIGQGIISYVSYLWMLIFPRRLAVFYPYPEGVAVWQSTGALLFLVFLTFLLVWVFRRKRYLAVGWLWYLGTLLPVIGLVQAGLWPAVADRWLYVPSIGVFIVVAWGIGEFVGQIRVRQIAPGAACDSDLVVKWRYRRIGLGITAGVVLVVLLICTRAQLRHWQNSFTLFGHALEVTDDNCVMHNNYGAALYDEGRFEEALVHLNEALRINQDYLKACRNIANVFLKQEKYNEAIANLSKAAHIGKEQAEVYRALGFAYGQLGEHGLAIQHYNRALQIDPDYLDARRDIGNLFLRQERYNEAIAHLSKIAYMSNEQAEVHRSLGFAYGQLGEHGLAIQHYNEALRLDPEDLRIRNSLGRLYLARGRFRESIRCFEEVLRIKRDWLDVYISLGLAYSKLGDYGSAVKNWTEAVNIKPDLPSVLNNLGWILAVTKDTKLHNPAGAVKYAEKACELTQYNRPDFLDTLATANAAVGDFPEAVKTAEKAIALALSLGRENLAAEIKKRLELYKVETVYNE
jgi:tetratricopeptide (TPR) repeat protein